MSKQSIKYVLSLFFALFLVVNPVLAQESLFDETKTIGDNQICYIKASLTGYSISINVSFNGFVN